MYLSNGDNIYYSKTRECINEFISNDLNGNYHSAIVLVCSIAICDWLLKVQECGDMDKDTVAVRLSILRLLEQKVYPISNKKTCRFLLNQIEDL